MAHRLPSGPSSPARRRGEGRGAGGAVLQGVIGRNSRYIQHHPLRDPRAEDGADGSRRAGSPGRGRRWRDEVAEPPTAEQDGATSSVSRYETVT
jgi:hypothetical protein